MKNTDTFYAVNRLKNLDIPVYNDFDPIIENMKDPVFKVKQKNDPSILAIRNTRKNSIFYLKKVTIVEKEKKTDKLSSKFISKQ